MSIDLRLKQWRRIASRDEKRASNDLAMLTVGAILLWPKDGAPRGRRERSAGRADGSDVNGGRDGAGDRRAAV
jgi:hypothetical protein